MLPTLRNATNQFNTALFKNVAFLLFCTGVLCLPYSKKREFSLYDIEEYLRDAGAEKVNEKALISFERELEEAVDGFINEAAVYANYAGRRKMIKYSDIELMGDLSKHGSPGPMLINKHIKARRRFTGAKSRVMLNKQVRKL